MRKLNFILILLLSQFSLFAQTDSVFTHPTLPPSYFEGEELMHLFLKWNLIYPPAAALRKAEGRIWVTANIDTFGRICAARILRGIAPDMDTAALKVVRIMPHWLPGYEEFGPVKSQIIVPVDFTLANYNEVDLLRIDTSSTSAMFPGGVLMLLTHIFSGIDYPKNIADRHLKGVALIRFLISAKGEISKQMIYKSFEPYLDRVALAATLNMPNWNPAIKGGHPVSTYYVLPVYFNTDIRTFKEFMDNLPDSDYSHVSIPRGMRNRSTSKQDQTIFNGHRSFYSF